MIMTNWSVVSDKTLQAVLKVCTVYGTSCHSNSVVSDFVCNLLRVLQQFNKILAKHSHSNSVVPDLVCNLLNDYI